jgi:hypothetical protein
MSSCTQINIPELNLDEERCNGKYYSSFCVVQETPLVPLGFPQPNANVSQILTAISNKIFAQESTITSLSEQVSELASQVESLQIQLFNCCTPPL